VINDLEAMAQGLAELEPADFAVLQEGAPGAEGLTTALREEAPPAPILRAALEGKSELCIAAVDLFVSLYGAEAGNLALKVMARGGVFLGGGIAPRILARRVLSCRESTPVGFGDR
jgi:glucokinase